MTPISKPLLIIAVLSALLFVAILVEPQTGWIIRDDVMSVVSPGSVLTQSNATERAFALARRLPEDYDVQLTAADPDPLCLNSSQERGAPPAPAVDEEVVLTSCEKLADRFQRKASAFACAIELSADFEHGVEWRPAQEKFSGSATTTASKSVGSSELDKRAVRDIEKYAKSGESIDPGNAFFPLALSTAYFADRQDDLAEAELARAGEDSRWNDYTADRVQAKWRTIIDLDGGIQGTALDAIRIGTTFPINARIRQAARVAVWLASTDERSGQIAKGLAIRHAIIRAGDVMRADSYGYIGTLVGTAITRIGMSRPGLGPHMGTNMSLPKSQQRTDLEERRLKTYQKYLIKAGNPDEAAYAQRIVAAGDGVLGLTSNAYWNHEENSDFLSLGLQILIWFFVLWIPCVAALCCLAELILFYRSRGAGVSYNCLLPLAAMLLLPVFAFFYGRRLLLPGDWSLPIATFGYLIDEPMKTLGLDVMCQPVTVFCAIIGIVTICRKRQVIATLRSASLITVTSLMLAASVFAVALSITDSLIQRDETKMMATGEGRYAAAYNGKIFPPLVPLSNPDISLGEPLHKQ